jgi:hypothetical protein
MPYFFNTQTGQYEAAQGPSEVHEYPLVSPEGEIGSASAEKYQALLQEGYRAPSVDELKAELKHQKFSTPVEQAKTFAEGAAKSATFGLSTGVERALGVNPEDILAREETNPGMALTGELVGFGASALVPGGGALGALTKGGEMAATRLATSKLGQQVVKQATEMAMISAGDEVSRAFAQDPDQTVQSIATNIGLSSVAGGLFGAAQDKIVEPLWKAAKGSELSTFLGQVRDKVQRGAGEAEINKMAQQAGMALPPEMRAAMSGSAESEAMAATLRESGTKSGDMIRQSFEQVQRDASDQAITALGKTKKDLAKLGMISEAEEGYAAKKALEQELKIKIDPVIKEFEAVEAKIGTKALPEGSVDSLAQKILKVVEDGGHALRSDSAASSELKSIMKDLPNIKTFGELQRFWSTVDDDLTSKQLFGLRKELKGIFRSAEDDAATTMIGQAAPEMLGQLAGARTGYRNLMDKVEALNDRLRVGKFGSPSGFRHQTFKGLFRCGAPTASRQRVCRYCQGCQRFSHLVPLPEGR